MTRRKRKKLFKGIFSTFIIVLVFILGASFISNIIKSNDDGLKKINLTWEIGGLTSTGKYVESDKSIYTKNLFDCNGLEVELDFDNNIKYQVFFYDEEDTFVESSQVLIESEKFTIPEDVTQARIVVTPIFDMKLESEKQVVTWYTKAKYYSQLDIYVSTLKLLDNEVEEGIYKVNITESSSLDRTIIMMTGQEELGFDTDFYRIYLYDGLDTTGFIHVIHTENIGQPRDVPDCDYELAATLSCGDEASLEIIELIMESSNPTNYLAYLVENTDGTRTIYFSLKSNEANFTDYINTELK